MITSQKARQHPDCLKFFLILFLSVFLISLSFAQTNVTLSGRVTDPDTKMPVPGVSVLIKGKVINGVLTDEKGDYTVTVPAGSELVFSYLGSVIEEVKVSKTGSLNVIMKSRPKGMDEVVVIGYGTRKKKDVTGAVSTVTATDIEKSTSMTPELALQGKAAGVFIESGGGAPGARPTVRIRGVNTFGFAEPLYVIDGLPIFEGGAGVTGGAIGDIRSPLNIFSMINPADIETMTVLKDASAAAIYGVRASNGVILITTKQGKTGKPRVEFTGSFGVQNIAKEYKTLNTQQYFQLLKESYAANPDANTSFAQKFGPLYDADSSSYVGNAGTYNWQNELKNKNATLQDYNVKVSGGNGGTTYYFSSGYAKTESPLKANELERYSFSANINSKISKFFEAGINVRLVSENALDNTQANLGDLTATIPFQPIYDKNDPIGFAQVSSGTFIINPAYDADALKASHPLSTNPTQQEIDYRDALVNSLIAEATASGAAKKIFDGGSKLLWGNQTRYNAFAFQRLNRTRYNLMNTLGNAYIQFEPFAGLKLKASLGGNYVMNLRKEFGDFEAWKYSQTPGNPYENQDGTAKGRYGERQGRTANLNKELTLNYIHTFNKDHSVDVILSMSDQYSKWNWTDGSSPVNYTNPQYWGISNQRPFASSAAGVLQEDALIGYLGRLSYKFKDRYYFDATIRRDGSSRLAPGHKYDNFPAFSAAWRISSEKFFPKTKYINDLKLRGGWGKLGNFQSAGAYQYLSGVSLSPDYSLGSGGGNSNGVQVQGASLLSFANTSLTWEKIKTSSIGFDAVLFNNHINFTAEYYSKLTYDIIQSVSLPPNTGIQQSADLNIATVQNKGIELQLGYNKSFGNINFNASANLTTVNNKVLKLNGGTPIGGEGGRIEEGYTLGYLWGYKVGGIFQNQAEIDKWLLANKGSDANIGSNVYKPGDMYFQNIYGDPRNKSERYSPIPDTIVNSNDRTYLGKTIPGYYYGFSTGAEYKGIDVNIFFQGVGEVQKYNGTRSGLESMSGPANQLATTLNRWTTASPSGTMPRAVYGDPFATARFSSRFVENASYLRLKNIQIGYTLPAGIMNKLSFAQKIRFYVSGVNLFTITKYSGLDPENDFLPPTRQLLFGVNAAF